MNTTAKTIAEAQEAREEARIAGLTDKQKARELVDNAFNRSNPKVARAEFARIAVEHYADYLSDKQMACMVKIAG